MIVWEYIFFANKAKCLLHLFFRESSELPHSFRVKWIINEFLITNFLKKFFQLLFLILQVTWNFKSYLCLSKLFTINNETFLPSARWIFNKILNLSAGYNFKLVTMGGCIIVTLYRKKIYLFFFYSFCDETTILRLDDNRRSEKLKRTEKY